MLYATHRLIDSVWTLVYEQVSDTEIKILAYARDITHGYRHEKELDNCELNQDEKRIVHSVTLKDYDSNFPFSRDASVNERTFTVTNSKHIFDYEKFKTEMNTITTN